ncbi:MAG: radical SAM protein [Candidatus Lokiarchaeota archaeon]|nr:radical SAM protein [Candidatus Lokiarchaeota archaeon]MBD3201292.1 radical SAM protein [Candidatus Lokiarchaeota archaeon]
MEYIYGPVASRRLGQSLGIDPLPSKTCNYQCIYCQLGKTTNFTNTRRNFFPKEEIILEIETYLSKNAHNFDYVTFVGSGEPTLYKDLKKLITTVRDNTNKPICVITNGSLLNNKEIQEALFLTDAVLPSLDAGYKKSFITINRPHPSLEFWDIVDGFKEFKNRYKGKFWIEIMLMKGINDSMNELLKIKKLLNSINPDRIDLNIPIRPPVENYVKIPRKEIINLLDDIFGGIHAINFPESGDFEYHSDDFNRELIKIIERHPLREEQIIETFKSKTLGKNEILYSLHNLESERIIEHKDYGKNRFWSLKKYKKK